jgi:hypothetical protein
MINRKLMNWILTFALLTIISRPALPQVTTSTSTETSYRSSKSTHQWRSSTGLTDFNIEYRGNIELTDDDKDIKSMSDDGYLEIDKTVFGSRRTIVIESLGAGKLKKEYYEGRTKMDWNPNGQSWLGEILPEIVQSTTLGAESRVARFYKQGGVARVLNEIEKMESDHTKSYYASLLMKQPIQAKDYMSIINTVAEEVDSDHYRSEFLKNNISKFMQNKEATSAVFAATRKMDSDHYKTVIIKEALKGQIASLDNVKIILQAAGQMESDHYITEVLSSLLRQDNLTDALISEMIKTTSSIESDHYKTVVLTKALDKQGLSSASHGQVIEAVKDIESDHYITQVIKHLLDNKLSDELLTLLLNIVGSIESDHYRTEVLKTLLDRQDITDTQFNKVMEACGNMDSDHYKGVIVQEAASISNMTDAKLITIINTTKRMDSDHYIATALTEVAPKVRGAGGAVKDAYRSAARSISSETYYGRALRALDE